MKCLIAIPHIFNPKENSNYSSESEQKRETKKRALYEATIGNINRHSTSAWLHASLGKGKKVVTRKIESKIGADITIQLYTDMRTSLANHLPAEEKLNIVDTRVTDKMQLAKLVSRKLLEQADNYDILGYMEDDLRRFKAHFSGFKQI